MNALRPLQAEFQDFLLERPSAVLDRIADAPRENRARLLDIYRNAYLSRLVEALGSDFPKLRRLAGEDSFDVLARLYLRAHPSTYRSIRWMGDGLAAFLARTPPHDARRALAEMAAFEWALAAAFDAADAEPATVAGLAAIPPEAWGSIRLTPHPSAQRLDLRTTVPEIWQRPDADLDPTTPEIVADTFAPWIVWRQVLSVKFRKLAEDEAWAYDRMAAGQPFEAVCEGLGRWAPDEEMALRAAGLLKIWIEAGIVARIDHDAPISA